MHMWTTCHKQTSSHLMQSSDSHLALLHQKPVAYIIFASVHPDGQGHWHIHTVAPLTQIVSHVYSQKGTGTRKQLRKCYKKPPGMCNEVHNSLHTQHIVIPMRNNHTIWYRKIYPLLYNYYHFTHLLLVLQLRGSLQPPLIASCYIYT